MSQNKQTTIWDSPFLSEASLLTLSITPASCWPILSRVQDPAQVTLYCGAFRATSFHPAGQPLLQVVLQVALSYSPHSPS